MSAPTVSQVLANAAVTASRRQIERAVSLTGHPTRPLTETELAKAVSILTDQGCVQSEIAMRLEMTRGEFDSWHCKDCGALVTEPGHTCVEVTR